MDSYPPSTPLTPLPPPPPPPYSEEDSRRPPLQKGSSSQFRINRKPLPTQSTESAALKRRNRQAVVFGGNAEDLKLVSRDVSPRPELSLETSVSPIVTTSQLYASPEDARPSGGGISESSGHESVSTTSLFPPSSASSISIPDSSTSPESSTSTSFVTKAYQEARHFAGGLISHPSESTKHYTILRHSHGLVFYQGSSTSLAISILSDAPLPLDRTLWLQSKGWSGRTGMKAKAFIGRNGNWLNVTPTTAVSIEQLNPHDERAWQRDLAKFGKKAHPKIRERHVVRETAVIRIPAEAGDGYFQIVMCIGDKKKVICPSPTFRLISTSTSPSSLRGASLATLPLELGVKLGAIALNTYASATAGAIAAPVTSVVKGSVQKYMPSFWTQEAVTKAYEMSGAGDTVSSVIVEGNARYDQTREQLLSAAGTMEVALEEGPKEPYPIHVVGRTQIGTSNIADELDMPVFGLTGVDDSVMLRLYGYYFGWARNIEKSDKDENIWCQAIVSAVSIDPSQLIRAKVAHANMKTVTVRLLSDLEDMPSNDAKFEVRILGFIRPDEPTQRATLENGLRSGDEAAHEAALLTEVNDVQMTQEILDHPSWSHEATGRPKLQERKSSGAQKIGETYANARMAAQRQMDRVPLHKVGIRLEVDKLRDKAIIAGGFFVIR